MKKRTYVMSLVLLAAFMVSAIAPVECSARIRENYRKALTDDKRLAEADGIYKKAVRYAQRGDGAFHKRPGEAVQFYSNAESYLNNTVFKLKETGYGDNIDVSNEIEFCEALRRDIHVKKGMAQKMAKR